MNCGDNGVCSDGLTGTGECVCDAGFAGDNCATCDTGYYGETCDYCLFDCGNYGSCSDGFTGTGLCICTAGYTGDSCDSCKDGYYGATCIKCGACGFGVCNNGLTGNGQCTCQEGWAGAQCDECAPGYYGVGCSPCSTCVNGQCNDGLSGDGVCVCDTNGGQTWSGAACDIEGGPCSSAVESAASSGDCAYTNTEICSAACSVSFSAYYEDCKDTNRDDFDDSTAYDERYLLCQSMYPKPPSDASELSVDVKSNSKVVLRWTAPSSTRPITGYLLQYRSSAASGSSAGAWVNVYVESEGLTSQSIDGLNTYTNYDFRFAAQNAYGTGGFSDVTSELTLPSKPSQPRDLQALSSGQTEVSLKWTVPSLTGGYTIAAYKLETLSSIQVEGQTTNIWGVLYQGKDASFQVTGLSESTTYRFRVSARSTPFQESADSYGDYSAELAVTTDNPTPPTLHSAAVAASAVTASSATVEWVAPYVRSGLPALLYEVQQQAGSTRSTVYIGADTATAVTGLSAASVYSYRVRVKFTGQEYGVYSDFTSFTTLAVAPDAPALPTVSSVTDTSFKLQWSPPVNDGGSAVALYSVCLDGEDCEKVYGTITSGTVEHQTPGSTVSVTVAAQNAIGVSGKSGTVSVSLLSAAPAITAFVGAGDIGNSKFGSGDTLTITFDQATNEPSVGDKASIDALLSVSQPIGTAYSGAWKNAGRELTITIDNAGGDSPAIGVLTVSVLASGGLKNRKKTSAVCTSTSPVITGNWGKISAQDSVDVDENTPVSAQEDTLVLVPVSLLTAALTSDAYRLEIDADIGSISLAADNDDKESEDDSLTLKFAGTKQLILVGTAAEIDASLTKLAYIPAANKNGYDPVSFTLFAIEGQSETQVDFKQQFISVAAVNDAPTVAGASAGSVAETTFSELDAFDVDDVDLTSSSTEELTVSLSASAGSIKYSKRVEGLSSNVAKDTATTLLTLQGTLSQLNAVLEGVSFQNPSESTGTDPYITVKVNDNGNIGGSGIEGDDSGAGDLQAFAEIILSTPCDQKAPPAPINAKWNDVASGFTVTFDRPVYIAASVQCGDIFDAASVDAMGAGAACTFVSATKLFVTLPRGSTISASAQVTLNQGAVTVCQGGTASVVTSLTLVSDAPPLAYAVLKAPTSVGLCDDLTLDGSGSYGFAGRTGRYIWSDTAGILSVADTSQSSVSIDTTEMSVGGSYTFCLQAVNFFNVQSALSCVTVSKFSADLPIVVIGGEAERTIAANEAVEVTGTIQLSACLAGSSQVNLQWSEDNNIDGLDLADTAATTKSLSLQPGSLRGGNSYRFTLTATMASDASLSASASITIHVVESDPVAVMKGGSLVSIGYQQTLVLNALDSYDPDDGTNAVLCSWACVASSGGTCFDANDEAYALGGSSNANCELVLDTLKVETVTFTVTVDKGTGVYGYASTTVEVKPGAPPAVTNLRAIQVSSDPRYA